MSRHIVNPSAPQVIQQRNPAGQWQGIAYAINVPDADAKLARLNRFNAGKGLRFRIIPAN